VFTTSGTYPWSLVTQLFHNDQTSHGGDLEHIRGQVEHIRGHL